METYWQATRIQRTSYHHTPSLPCVYLYIPSYLVTFNSLFLNDYITRDAFRSSPILNILIR